MLGSMPGPSAFGHGRGDFTYRGVVSQPGFATIMSPEVTPDVEIDLQLVSWLATPRGVVDPRWAGAGEKRWLGDPDITALREALLSALGHGEADGERGPLEEAPDSSDIPFRAVLGSPSFSLTEGRWGVSPASRQRGAAGVGGV